MSELTHIRQDNGLYCFNYINGEWASWENVTKEDKLKINKMKSKHDKLNFLYDNYLELDEAKELNRRGGRKC